ncbi:MAG: TetR/AcrR family transcriptional regulator [Corynebacterium sp.]|nr:TetR/AcrR family transcriptional regulator [Corynebacterium sp.]
MSMPMSGDPSIENVISVALEVFGRNGFEDTRLDVIAQESGMSKRMIHYHFGDKKGLYTRAVQMAIEQLRPTPDHMITDTIVPAEGIQAVVEVIFDQMARHPKALRLLTMENLLNDIPMLSANPLADQSSILLQTDRILMLGQDAGAFRPGISALDVYALITSMCVLRLASRGTFQNLYGTDLQNERNTEGLKRLTVDAVLSFLTANLPPDGNMSYLQGEYKQDPIPAMYEPDEIYDQ